MDNLYDMGDIIKLYMYNQSQLPSMSGYSRRVQQRAAFKMVPSVFEPPEDTQPSSYQQKTEPRTSPLYILDDSQEPSHNANMEFFKGLVDLRDPIYYEQGDAINVKSDDHWVLASGELKLTAYSGYWFVAEEGFLFFINSETKKKIKEILCLRSSVLFCIPHAVFAQQVRSFLYLKNGEKIKFLKYCPFLALNQNIAQDVAITMKLIDNFEKDCEIYRNGDEAEDVYFVKEGIVLLERVGKIQSEVVQEYQKHYQSTHLSQEEAILIVRKGMIFGIDGVLIKEREISIPQEANPEHMIPYNEAQNLKNTRFYSARAIGKCELYSLKRSVIQTFFRTSDLLRKSEREKVVNHKQLERVAVQYTNLLMGVSDQPKKFVNKKSFVFNKIKENANEELEEKKKKIQQIKKHEKRVKKIYAGRIEPRTPRHESTNPFKKQISNKTLPKTEQKNISLPILQKKKIEAIMKKKMENKEHEKFEKYKQKVDQEILSHHNQLAKDKFMKVTSYRSLAS